MHHHVIGMQTHQHVRKNGVIENEAEIFIAEITHRQRACIHPETVLRSDHSLLNHPVRFSKAPDVLLGSDNTRNNFETSTSNWLAHRIRCVLPREAPAGSNAQIFRPTAQTILPVRCSPDWIGMSRRPPNSQK